MKETLKLALEALEGFYEYGYDRQECFEHITAIKAALAKEQEPVAKYSDIVSDGGLDPRNTTPPQRTWVGLDEKDFSAINQSCLTKLQAATSAESILKEKNNGLL